MVFVKVEALRFENGVLLIQNVTGEIRRSIVIALYLSESQSCSNLKLSTAVAPDQLVNDMRLVHQEKCALIFKTEG